MVMLLLGLGAWAAVPWDGWRTGWEILDDYDPDYDSIMYDRDDVAFGQLEALGHPLAAAAANGHTHICSLLLLLQRNLHPKVIREAICSAAKHGHLDVVQLLVEKRPESEEPGLGGSPLMKAAEEGHLDVVEYFLKQGADVANSQDSPWSAKADRQSASWEQHSALAAAAAGGHVLVVTYLLKYLLDPAAGSERGEDDDTAADYVAGEDDDTTTEPSAATESGTACDDDTATGSGTADDGDTAAAEGDTNSAIALHLAALLPPAMKAAAEFKRVEALRLLTHVQQLLTPQHGAQHPQ
jgi:ankyrin repeat protein